MITDYESEHALSEYLLFHYGEPGDILQWPFGPGDSLDFPKRCVSECLNTSALPANARALDLGCAVGRSSFELARHCSSVLGIDTSQQFIRAACHLKKAGQIGFDRFEEGALTSRCIVKVPYGVDRARAHFEVGDAVKLRPNIGEFDVVLAANLLCRLSDPIQLVLKFAQLLRAGGQLILTSPYTWLREITPQAKWLGGFEENGKRFDTFVTLQKFLGADFELHATHDMPFLIREHARKFQWSIAHASIWVRR